MAVAFILVTIVVVVVVLWFLSRPRSLDLPSPPGHPIIGNLLQLLRPRMHETLAELSQKLGPVFCVRLLTLNIVIVNDYDSIHTVLVKQGNDFAGRSALFLKRFLFVRDDQFGIIFGSPSTEWKFLRKTAHTNMTKYEKGLRRVESVNMAAIEDMVSELNKQEMNPYNPRTLVSNTALNIMCGFLLGRSFTMDDPFFVLTSSVAKKLASVTSYASKGFELEIMWWLRHFGNKNFKDLELMRDEIRKLWGLARTMVNQDLSEGTGRGGIIHDLMTALNDEENSLPDSVDEDSISAIFSDLIIAGTSTTSKSFYSLMNIIANKPEVQAKLREEVDTVVGPDRAVAFDDRQSMPYTRAVITELTRYQSIVTLGIPHQAITDTFLDGHRIPMGTTVMTNLWALHHDEKFWGDPWEFRPERFLDDQGELLAADHERRRHVLAFGAGPRVCLGDVLALGRLFLLVATVVQRFELVPGPTPVSCDPRQYESAGGIGSCDYELRFLPRHAST